MIEIDLEELDLQSSQSRFDWRQTDVTSWSIGHLCKLILTDAPRRGADQIRIEPELIHIESQSTVPPHDERFSVLFRIDGRYDSLLHVPLRLYGGLTERLKNWARVGIAGEDRPQSGVLTVRIKCGRQLRIVEYILETFPGPNGETLVLTQRGSSRET